MCQVLSEMKPLPRPCWSGQGRLPVLMEAGQVMSLRVTREWPRGVSLRHTVGRGRARVCEGQHQCATLELSKGLPLL